MSANDISSLSLSTDQIKNLDLLGYKTLTPVQSECIPAILAGKDLIVQAKTGSGKTAAFGLGLVEKINQRFFGVQSLVLCPTRELADQVATELRKLARCIPNIKLVVLCGGKPLRKQVDSLEHGAHIVVGTPGRIKDHLSRETLDLSQLKTLVLDEADRMLDMGFQDELDAIVAQAPARRQTLLFSATYPEKIKSIADRIMADPVMVKVASSHDSSSIEPHFYEVDEDHRMVALRLLLQHHRPESSVVFCETKIEAQEVSDELAYGGFSTLALHGDLEQGERDETLVRFANKSVSILVATDVAARGLDIDAIDVVFNYRVSQDFEQHVHRIGRTGRAGSQGMACSLYCEKERDKISRLQDTLGQILESEPLPSPSTLDGPKMEASMVTLKIGMGKKQKLRPGNILGALTGDNGLDGSQVGKIDIFDHRSYVAVTRDAVTCALKKLGEEKLLGRSMRGWLIRD
jgi:ATP-independent RNA helicase DbpA